MCIIIVNKTGLLAKNIIETSFENNNDGMGLMFAKKGRIRIQKSLNNVDVFYNNYKIIRENNPDLAIILHFRIGTSGKNDLVNCHPFMINNDLAFCHNGIIQKTSLPQSEYNDTYLFNEKILKFLPHDFLKMPAICELIKGYIGYSKLAFLHSSGEFDIINEEDGHWLDGNWYSNSTYKEFQYATYKYEYPAWNYKGNKWGSIYDDVECEYCGKTLYTYDEKYKKICIQCEYEMHNKCEYCDCVLTSISERANGVCNECTRILIGKEQ